MERRKFLGKGIGGGFLVGAAAGVPAGVAGTLAGSANLLRPDCIPVHSSNAQQGEDLVLNGILRGVLDIRRPTYLDVGAHHPIASNNTYFFYERGARGVLVEPNPALHGELAKWRPHDVLMRAGIGVSGQTEADYFVIGPGDGTGDGQINTFSREQADTIVAKLKGYARIEKVLKLPLLDINELMLRHWNGAPNLLSLDTEGFELPILRSLDFARLRPDVICVDTLEIGGRHTRDDIARFMTEQGYDARGGSFVNTIFVDRRHIT